MPSPETIELVQPQTVAAVLADLGVVPRGELVRAQALSGGISNVVLGVDWSAGRAVLKQSLPKLRVAADWTFDRSRIINERRCMTYLGGILPSGAVPSVVAQDDQAFLFVMTRAPEGAEVWKDQLLVGHVDLDTARRSGALLGLIHARSSVDPYVGETFADLTPLIQGRVDPYHRTAAALNPDVAPAIAEEVDRLLSTQRALVMGDWSPKNLLAYPTHVMALDFEVAHYGDPAFDVAFLLTHLVLKSVHRPLATEALWAAAAAFLDGYRLNAGAAAPPDAAVVAELGCLLLARVDGKSPAEYITADSDRGRIRAAAYELLLGGERRLAPTLDHLLAS